VIAPRPELRDLAEALRTLHQRLLRAVQKNFEKLHGRVDGPGALLKLAVEDALFAWLRPMSRELALLDELLANPEPAGESAVALARIAALLDRDSEFRASYLVYLQDDPDVVMAHAAVRQVLERAVRQIH
jgi:hypothetical protein